MCNVRGGRLRLWIYTLSPARVKRKSTSGVTYSGDKGSACYDFMRSVSFTASLTVPYTASPYAANHWPAPRKGSAIALTI